MKKKRKAALAYDQMRAAHSWRSMLAGPLQRECAAMKWLSEEADVDELWDAISDLERFPRGERDQRLDGILQQLLKHPEVVVELKPGRKVTISYEELAALGAQKFAILEELGMLDATTIARARHLGRFLQRVSKAMPRPTEDELNKIFEETADPGAEVGEATAAALSPTNSPLWCLIPRPQSRFGCRLVPQRPC